MGHLYVFWIGFHVLILLLLVIDIGVFQKKPHAIKLKEALLLSAFWVLLALLFNGFIYLMRGPDAAVQFFTGYLIEKTLSVDNLFVFLMIFSYFKVPSLYQHKILYWGILGALIFRIVLILVGVELIREFHWIIYALGAFLFLTGIKFLLQQEKTLAPEDNWVVRLCYRYIPLSQSLEGGEFFKREQGKLKMTYLFVVLLMIESTDLIFALDSIPAIFAVTTDPFIVYTSNIFAILGLRSLYFALAHVLNRLKYFKFGLAAILIFIGAKMLLSTVYPIETWIVLVVVVSLLIVTTITSLIGKTD